MGLTSTTRSGVQTAFNAVGDLKTTISHVAVTLTTYDVATDVQSKTEVTTILDAVLVKEKAAEADWTPKDKNVLKCLIAYTDLATEPGLDDYILISGVTWEIMAVNKVPGNSVWILRIREP